MSPLYLLSIRGAFGDRDSPASCLSLSSFGNQNGEDTICNFGFRGEAMGNLIESVLACLGLISGELVLVMVLLNEESEEPGI